MRRVNAVACPVPALQIAGYEGAYWVTMSGRVWSAHAGRYLAARVARRGKGYLYVSLWRDNKETKFYVHQLVATAFVPNPLGLPTVNHEDGDTRNNDWRNLEWATHQDQQDHAWSTGLSHHFGEDGTNVKLTSEQVQQIPQHLASGKSQREVGRLLGVSQSQISRIAAGKRWARATKELACM